MCEFHVTIEDKLIHMKLKTIIHRVCLAVSLLLAGQSLAQQNAITGKITDATTGDGLPGVNILIKGTLAGAVTDLEGNFSLRAQPSDVLNISFVGYVTREIEVGTQNHYQRGLGVGYTVTAGGSGDWLRAAKKGGRDGCGYSRKRRRF